MRSLCRLVSVASILCACGGDEPEAPSIATVEAFVEQAHGAACDAFFRCGVSSNDLAVTRALLGDAARCASLRAGTAALGWGDVNELPATVRLGKARYNGTAALRCLTRLRATCDVTHPLAEMCSDVFAGTVAAGAVCQRHEDCAGGGWCDRGQATGALRCPGMCVARKPLGSECVANEECALGADGQRAECFPDAGGTSRCIRVRTGTTADDGMPCGHLVTSGGGLDIPCATGLACVFASGSLAGTCRRPQAVGAMCSETTACATGSACAATTTMRCTAIQVRRSAGERCSAATFELCDGNAGLTCRSGMCASVGGAAMGATCAAAMGVPMSALCGAGLACVGGRCATRLADGAACMGDATCASGACDRSTSVCAPRTCR
jgi:hypothetical protein